MSLSRLLSIQTVHSAPALTFLCQTGDLRLPHNPHQGGEDKDFSSCLVFTDRSDLGEVTDSLVFQSVVTAATSKSRVTVLMCGTKLSEMPSPWHLMPPVNPTVMKTVSFLYPATAKVSPGS